MKSKNVEISPARLYQLLVSELRYGYSRNNHLMPSVAYKEAEKDLNEMLKVNAADALLTAQQLCEECINLEIGGNFYDALDDEFGNRKTALEFVNTLLDFIHTNGSPSYTPYNHEALSYNLKKGENLGYTLFKTDNYDFDISDIKNIKKDVIVKNVSFKKADTTLITDVLTTDKGTGNIRKLYTVDYPRRVIGEVIRIITPENHAGEIYVEVLSEYLGEENATAGKME